MGLRVSALRFSLIQWKHKFKEVYHGKCIRSGYLPIQFQPESEGGSALPDLTWLPVVWTPFRGWKDRGSRTRPISRQTVPPVIRQGLGTACIRRRMPPTRDLGCSSPTRMDRPGRGPTTSIVTQCIRLFTKLDQVEIIEVFNNAPRCTKSRRHDVLTRRYEATTIITHTLSWRTNRYAALTILMHPPLWDTHRHEAFIVMRHQLSWRYHRHDASTVVTHPPSSQPSSWRFHFHAATGQSWRMISVTKHWCSLLPNKLTKMTQQQLQQHAFSQNKSVWISIN